MKEKNRSLDERLTKLEKEVKRHKTKDYHGYGFRDGGWWKNILSNSQANLVLLPFSLFFGVVCGSFIEQLDEKIEEQARIKAIEYLNNIKK